jgi:ribosomal protein S18 acetylase RimI-like enzyme
MKCHYDDRTAHFRCAQTGEYVCPSHARLDVVSVATRAMREPLPVRAAEPRDQEAIAGIAESYWGELEVECFGLTYDLAALPAFVACSGSDLAGVLSYALEGDRLTIVMVNVLPEFQGRSTARALLAAAEAEARKRGLARLVVATSNDDLPALYLYQRWGFAITEVVPGAILTHHGREERGFAAIPVRDEIRLELLLAQ